MDPGLGREHTDVEILKCQGEKAMRATLEWQARLRNEVKRLREMGLDTLQGQDGSETPDTRLQLLAAGSSPAAPFP